MFELFIVRNFSFFMTGFDRDKFNDMTTQQKVALVNDLVLRNLKLSPEEMKYLVPQNKEAYLSNRIKTSDWLEDYEFNYLSEDEKEVYIWLKRYLSKEIIENLSPKLQKEFISCSIMYGISLGPKEFEILCDDDMRRYYVKEKVKYSVDSTLTARELSFLDSKGQMSYLNFLKRNGLAPNPDEILSLTPESLRFYYLKLNVNEIRSIVRSELIKIL